MNLERPNVFKFHDPVHYITELLSYFKSTKNQFNLNSLSKKSGLSLSNISMILNRQRPLTEKSFQKLIPHFSLSTDEKKYLNHLRIINLSDEQSVRIESLNQIIKIAKSKNANSNDLKVFEYLTSWYNVAIFELVNLTDFQMNPAWIQQRLIKRVSIGDIENAIQFLKSHNFIGQDENGKWIQLKQDLNCQGGIYRLSLSEFHRQIFELAHASIETVAREDRFIMGQTMALSAKDFEKLKEVIQNAVSSMNAVNKNNTEKTDVYHIEIAAFPMILNKQKLEEKNEK